jgi:hypothetical protein
MRRIYQWLSERASFFRYDAAGNGASGTLRTEVRVRRERTTVVAGNMAASIDVCPLCGTKLALTQAEPARPRRHR